jgi:flagellar motor switch protein FliN/FliY
VKSYLECWIGVASTLFSQALAGEPQLHESPAPSPSENEFGFEFVLSGDEQGRFTVLLQAKALESPLVGEGVDQKAGWAELLREAAEAAAGELLAKTGKKCRVDRSAEIARTTKVSRTFLLKAASDSWTVWVGDETVPKSQASEAPRPAAQAPPAPVFADPQPAVARSGYELLLDVELEATLRFGCRELLLSEILELGPGDVVELDRHVTDPVDLIVADKIVAKGEVVLVNGNFGLRVTEVAAPRKRLESIRCLF